MIGREIHVDARDCLLRGTYCAPSDGAATAVVLMIHGSGPLDRDENVATQRLDVFNTIAHRLAKAGIASLRYDKRGCGRSTGDYLSAGQADFVADAVAWIDRLSNEVGAPLYLLGHSEGCVISPRVSLERPQVAGIVLLCPPLTPFETILLQQAAQLERDIAVMPGFAGLTYRLLVRLTGKPTIRQREVIARIKNSKVAVLRLGIRKIEARSMRDLLELDQRALFERVTCPMLAIGGAKDVQCDPADAFAIAAINPRAEAHVIADLTHVLRRDERAPSVFGYRALLGKPIDAEVLDRIETWLLKESASRPSRASRRPSA